MTTIIPWESKAPTHLCPDGGSSSWAWIPSSLIILATLPVGRNWCSSTELEDVAPWPSLTPTSKALQSKSVVKILFLELEMTRIAFFMFGCASHLDTTTWEYFLQHLTVLVLWSYHLCLVVIWSCLILSQTLSLSISLHCILYRSPLIFIASMIISYYIPMLVGFICFIAHIMQLYPLWSLTHITKSSYEHTFLLSFVHSRNRVISAHSPQYVLAFVVLFRLLLSYLGCRCLTLAFITLIRLSLTHFGWLSHCPDYYYVILAMIIDDPTRQILWLQCLNLPWKLGFPIPLCM